MIRQLAKFISLPKFIVIQYLMDNNFQDESLCHMMTW